MAIHLTKCPDCGSPARVKGDGTWDYHVRVHGDMRACGAVGKRATPLAERPPAAKKAAPKKAAPKKG